MRVLVVRQQFQTKVLIDGRYGWWIQLPLKIHYSGLEKHSDASIVLQALVVRVPTTN